MEWQSQNEKKTEHEKAFDLIGLLTNFNIISELTAAERLQHSAVKWNLDA